MKTSVDIQISDKSLEEAAYKYSFDSRPSIYGQVDVIDAFKAGAEWQQEKCHGCFNRDEVFLRGMKYAKEQMLNEAVEGEAEELYNDGESQCVVSVGTYFKPGDKVYVLKDNKDESK